MLICFFYIKSQYYIDGRRDAGPDFCQNVDMLALKANVPKSQVSYVQEWSSA